MKKQKYNLVGVDGNAFGVMGYVIRAMKREGYSQEAIAKYRNEAMSGDYNNLLAVSAKAIDDINGGVEL